MEDFTDATFVVVGMHRSGTSALTRATNLMGPSLPKNVMAADQHNVPGYWEPSTIVQLNDAILSCFDRHWADPKPLPDGWAASEEFSRYGADAKRFLAREFESSGSIVLKDPRLSRVLPVWREALTARNAVPVYLIACRNPLEVACSLAERDKLSVSHGLHLWLSYMLDAELNTRDAHRVVVRYEELLRDWRAALGPVSRYAGLPDLEAADAGLLRSIDDFLSSSQRHHAVSKLEMDADPRVPSIVRRAYELFTRLSEGDDVAGFDRISEEWRAFWRSQSPGAARSAFVDQIPHVQFEKSFDLEEQGQIGPALDCAKGAVAGSNSDFRYQFRLAALLEKTGDPCGAADAYRLTLNLNDRLAGAYLGLARVLKQQDRLEAATATLRSGRDRHPANAPISFQLGLLLEQANDLSAAAEMFQRAKELDDAIVGAHLGLARALRQQDRSDEATAVLQAAYIRHPDNAPVSFQLGISLEQSGDLSGAEKAFRQAVELNNGPVGAYLGLARVLKLQMRLEDAKTTLLAAHSRHPDNAPVNHQLGLSLEQSDDLSGAAEFFRKALSMNDGLVAAHLSLARVVRAQGQPDEAIAILQTAGKRHPDHALVSHQLGILLEQAGDLPGAAAAYRKALSLNDELVGAHLGLARAIRKQGRLNEAGLGLQASIQRHPDSAELHQASGFLFELMGNLAAAENAHRAAAEIDAETVRRMAERAIASSGTSALTEPENIVRPSVPERYALVRLLAWEASGQFARESEDLIARPTAGELLGDSWPLGEIFPLATEDPVVQPADVDDGPSLSVMIPTFNVKSEEWLGRCIESVLAQDVDYDRVEIVIVDDGSTNGISELVARRFGHRVKYLRNEHNLGLCGNFNRCIELSTGQFVHILHQDDWIGPDFYGALLQPLLSDEQIVAAFSKSVDVNEDGRTITVAPSYREQPGRLESWSNVISSRQVLDTVRFPSVIMRRRALEAVGGYSPSLSFTVDWDMFVRLAAHGPIWYDPVPLAYFRSHSGSETFRQQPVARTIDSMRTALRNIRLIPENRRLFTARAAYFHDLLIAGNTLWSADSGSLSQDARKTTLRLLLRGQENDSYGALARVLFDPM